MVENIKVFLEAHQISAPFNTTGYWVKYRVLQQTYGPVKFNGLLNLFQQYLMSSLLEILLYNAIWSLSAENLYFFISNSVIGDLNVLCQRIFIYLYYIYNIKEIS